MGSHEAGAQQGGSHSFHFCLRMADNPEIWKAVAMADHFEKIQKLADPIPGCPNFRRVPGYKVYLCGQPTADGFEKALETVPGMDLTLLKMDRYKMDPNKDALFRGEFEVIKELVTELGADGEACKRECDKVIDKN